MPVANNRGVQTCVGFKFWRELFAFTLLVFAANSALSAPADSSRSFAKPLPSRTVLERIVSFPGQLAYSPVRYTVLGLGYAGVYLDDTGFMQRASSLFRRAGLLPVYAPRTGAGLRYTKNDYLGDSAKLVLTASSWVDARQLYSIAWEEISLGHGVESGLMLRYRSLTAESFYGKSPRASESDRLSYSAEDVLFELSLQKDIHEFVQASIEIGMSNTSVFDGRDHGSRPISDVYSENTLPGLKDDTRLQGTEFRLRYDDTNDSAHPSTGRIGVFSASLFNDIHNDELSFWKTSADLTQHIHLFRDRILALRSAAEMTQGIEGSDIPFYHLAEIGSYGTIRGFSRGRFRDNDFFLASAEYRYPIWIPWHKAVDAVVFVDGGQVSHDIIEEVALSDWQFGYGGGFRFYNTTGLIAKTELAFSSEAMRFYFSLNTP